MGISFSSRRMPGYKRKAPRRYVGMLKKKPWLRLWKRTKNATSHSINTRSGYDYIPLRADDTAVLLDADEVDTRNVDLLTDSNDTALDLYGPYQLMFACCHGYIDIVFELLSTHDRNDMDLNLPNNDGNTAFLLAIINGHTDIVVEFLKHDQVDVNHPNHKGDTALTWATNSGHMEIMDALLKHPRVHVNHHNNNGDTALLRATKKNYIDIVGKLLDHDEVDTNCQDRNGWTALAYASWIGRTDMVVLLLKHGKVNLNLLTKAGHTALSLASIHFHTNTVWELLKHDPYEALAWATAKSRTETLQGIDDDSYSPNETCRDYEVK